MDYVCCSDMSRRPQLNCCCVSGQAVNKWHDLLSRSHVVASLKMILYACRWQMATSRHRCQCFHAVHDGACNIKQRGGTRRQCKLARIDNMWKFGRSCWHQRSACSSYVLAQPLNDHGATEPALPRQVRKYAGSWN